MASHKAILLSNFPHYSKRNTTMRCKASFCNGILSPTRQFKRILVPHKSGEEGKVTWVTLDGSVKGYPVVEEDLCSKCLSSVSSYSLDHDYLVNVLDESDEEDLNFNELGLDIPDIDYSENY